MSQPTSNLVGLPRELLDKIFKHLDIESMQNLRKTCKFLRDRLESFRDRNELLVEEWIKSGSYDTSTDSDLAYAKAFLNRIGYSSGIRDYGWINGDDQGDSSNDEPY